MIIREKFPPYGFSSAGAESNGLVFRTTFAGSTLSSTLAMLRAFLDEEGYENIPIPDSDEEMLAFDRPENGGHSNLFHLPSYAHPPVRISFVRRDRLKKKLVLELYNENAPYYLVRFHRRIDEALERSLVASLASKHYEEFGSFLE